MTRHLKLFSLLLLTAVVGCGSDLGRPLPTLFASIETDPVSSSGDAADDPVVLVHEEYAFIVGTNKKRGLHVYDLGGSEVTAIQRGALNNVDAIWSAAESLFLMAASNRSIGSLDIFSFDPLTQSISLRQAVPLDLDEPYGLCAGSGQIFVGDKRGKILSYNWQGGGPLLQLDFSSQTEGCVVDEVANRLYVAEEDVGIWRVDLDTMARSLLAAVDDYWLTADVEGIDIYRGSDASFLVASSQGDSSFVLFDLASGQAVFSFRVVDNPELQIDGVEGTDGIAVHPGPLAGFPNGLLVVQDDRNIAPSGGLYPQNFKFIDWSAVETRKNASE